MSAGGSVDSDLTANVVSTGEVAVGLLDHPLLSALIDQRRQALAFVEFALVGELRDVVDGMSLNGVSHTLFCDLDRTVQQQRCFLCSLAFLTNQPPRIHPIHRIRHVLVDIVTAGQANRVLVDEATSLGVVEAEQVVVQAGLNVVVLALEAQRVVHLVVLQLQHRAIGPVAG